ncbi:zinc-dependent alcohol dehydrogenase family protein [Terriglobus roseus]|uniref:NADPH:quinone reductase n=1 Tax=Terriglobus roseus TaxID=392734 RepID=A0A1G7LHC1_9BACT|nr:NAD(P)-dependent alcohol dehydrogenase [Terriglobus roseus]SDF48833.1 NADPH:quinone reductase [Terriglobus roseus]
MTATALRLSGDFSIDALTFDDVTLPEPAPHEVLVKIHAVSLNYRDLMLVQGRYDPHVQKPRIPCSDGAGEVVAVGSAVTAFRKGDRVVAPFFLDWLDGPPTAAAPASALGGAIDGTLATHQIFPERALVAIPEKFSYAEAATFPCAATTAWHALVSTANIGPQDTVLLLGTGGVSIFGLQIAKLRGARILITSSSDDKLGRALSLGADHGINYRRHPDWDKQVRDITGKVGATHVLEVGGAGTLPLSLRSAAIGAQVSVIGVLTGLEEPLNIGQILMKTLRVQGIYVGSRAMLAESLQAFADNDIHPIIDRTFEFERAKEAFHALEKAHHFGKTVITFPA